MKEDIGTFAIGSFLATLIGSITFGICAGPMAVGLFMMVHGKLRGNSIEIGNVFKGFQKFGPAFVVFILILIASSVIGFVLGITGIGAVLGPFVGIAIGGAMFFAFQIVAEQDVGGVDAMKMSWEKTKSVFEKCLNLLAGLASGALLDQKPDICLPKSGNHTLLTTISGVINSF